MPVLQTSDTVTCPSPGERLGTTQVDSFCPWGVGTRRHLLYDQVDLTPPLRLEGHSPGSVVTSSCLLRDPDTDTLLYSRVSLCPTVGPGHDDGRLDPPVWDKSGIHTYSDDPSPSTPLRPTSDQGSVGLPSPTRDPEVSGRTRRTPVTGAPPHMEVGVVEEDPTPGAGLETSRETRETPESLVGRTGRPPVRKVFPVVTPGSTGEEGLSETYLPGRSVIDLRFHRCGLGGREGPDREVRERRPSRDDRRGKG